MAAATTTLNSLELSGVTVPGRIQAIRLGLAPGSLVGLIGPNGSGKSTLLQVAAGLLPAVGEVVWSGRRLGSIPFLERGRCAAWVPQEARFEFGFSIRAVVGQGRFAHGDDDRRVEEALARFDLTTLADRAVNRLSGGERQRVLLARAFATEAALQLWDEPLASLDPCHALQLLSLARELTRAGRTVLFSLHDLRVAHAVDQVAVLQRGCVRAFGQPSEVLTPQLLNEVFGVKVRTAPGLAFELP